MSHLKLLLGLVLGASLSWGQFFNFPANRIVKGAGAPSSGLCAGTADVGKVYIRQDIASSSFPLYICSNNGVGTYDWVTSGSSSGTVTVVGAGSLTSTAIVTGGGSQTIQTPEATATLDADGNISTPGTISAGVGGSVGGALNLAQGTASSAAASSIGIQAPLSVTTPYLMTYPGAPSTGFLYTTGTSDPTTVTFVPTVPVANGGTGLTAGTSGGVLCYTASGTLASSGALTANLPVIGGGAGVCPTVGTRSGNTTAYVTTTGAQTSGDCVKIDANGNHIANGSACGGGSSDPFSLSATPWLNDDPFCSNTGTTGVLGTTGYQFTTNAAGGVASDVDGLSFSGAPCGIRLLNDADSGTYTALYSRASNTGNAGRSMMQRAQLAAKAYDGMWLFYTPSTIANATIYIGLGNDSQISAATRSVLSVRFLQGTDSTWVTAISSGGGMFTVGTGGCAASAAPVASRFYVLMMDNDTGSTTYNVHLYVSATDYVTAQGTTDLFTSCTVTLPNSTEGFGPVVEIMNSTTEAESLIVHRVTQQLAY